MQFLVDKLIEEAKSRNINPDVLRIDRTTLNQLIIDIRVNHENRFLRAEDLKKYKGLKVVIYDVKFLFIEVS